MTIEFQWLYFRIQSRSEITFPLHVYWRGPVIISQMKYFLFCSNISLTNIIIHYVLFFYYRTFAAKTQSKSREHRGSQTNMSKYIWKYVCDTKYKLVTLYNVRQYIKWHSVYQSDTNVIIIFHHLWQWKIGPFSISHNRFRCWFNINVVWYFIFLSRWLNMLICLWLWCLSIFIHLKQYVYSFVKMCDRCV